MVYVLGFLAVMYVEKARRETFGDLYLDPMQKGFFQVYNKNMTGGKVSQQDALQEIRQGDDETINIIRKERLDSKKFTLDAANTWYDNIALVCFGLGGALIPYAATFHIKNIHDHKLWLWLAIAAFIANGVVVFLQKKRNIEQDQNDLQTLGLKEEYYLVKRRNSIDRYLMGGENAFQEVVKNTKDIQKIAKEAIHQNRQIGENAKISFNSDLIMLLLLSGLYFLFATALPYRSRWSILVYILLVIIYWFYLRDSLHKARSSRDMQKDWNQKLRDEEEKSLKDTNILS